MAPLAVPRLPPSRLYFLFQQPIHTSPEDLKVRRKKERKKAAAPPPLTGYEVCGGLYGMTRYIRHTRPTHPHNSSAQSPRSFACRTGSGVMSCTVPLAARWRRAWPTYSASGRRTRTRTSCPAACTRRRTAAARRPHSRSDRPAQQPEHSRPSMHTCLHSTSVPHCSQHAIPACTEPLMHASPLAAEPPATLSCKSCH